jgi:hypothetical protein
VWRQPNRLDAEVVTAGASPLEPPTSVSQDKRPLRRCETWSPIPDGPQWVWLLVRPRHLPGTPSGAARVAVRWSGEPPPALVPEPLSEPLSVVFHTSPVTPAADRVARRDVWHGILRIRYAVPNLVIHDPRHAPLGSPASRRRCARPGPPCPASETGVSMWHEGPFLELWLDTRSRRIRALTPSTT